MGDLKNKANAVIEALKNIYKDPKLELEYSSPFELLVEAILAAQESDKKVNAVMKEFFKKYKSPVDIASAPLEDLEGDLSSINFYRRKAKLLKSCCSALIELFGGKVPSKVEDLIKLPGVGRKTANMIVGGAFGKPAIIVDRHVMRVSQRIGFTTQKDPDKIEMELREIVPEDKWTLFSLLLLNHGKTICTAKDPRCGECPVSKECNYYNQSVLNHNKD